MKESGAADGEAEGVEMLRGPSAPDAGTGLYEPPRSPSPPARSPAPSLVIRKGSEGSEWPCGSRGARV